MSYTFGYKKQVTIMCCSQNVDMNMRYILPLDSLLHILHKFKSKKQILI